MNYYIKLHFLSKPDYEGIDELSDTYNETLDLLWKEKEVFYDDIKKEFTNTYFFDYFAFEWVRKIWESDYKIVKVYFVNIEENEINEFSENFLSFLKDKVQFIYKFEDNRFLEIRSKFFLDIYRIETSLREVISFIFFTTYYYIWEFLKDLEIDDVTKKYNLKFEDLKNNFENEFFYISFSDYKKLLNLKKLKEDEKIELLRDSYSFEDWKKRIFERGLKDEPYIDFINSIKQDLEILEQFRNAIMHNHIFTQKLKQSYEMAKSEILRKIEEFKMVHISIFWNELGLLIWNGYECTVDMKNFKKWKKYKLIKISDFWDYIFIWDDWDELSFRDKEFYQYFK